MQKQKQTTQGGQKTCFTPRLTHQEANNHWLRTRKDKAATFLSNFMLVVSFITGNMRSFSYSDVLREMLKFENSGTPEQIRRTFEAWASHLIGLSKLEEVNGCLNEPIYIVL